MKKAPRRDDAAALAADARTGRGFDRGGLCRENILDRMKLNAQPLPTDRRTEAEIWVCFVLLSRTQAGPDRTVKQEQE